MTIETVQRDFKWPQQRIERTIERVRTTTKSPRDKNVWRGFVSFNSVHLIDTFCGLLWFEDAKLQHHLCLSSIAAPYATYWSEDGSSSELHVLLFPSGTNAHTQRKRLIQCSVSQRVHSRAFQSSLRSYDILLTLSHLQSQVMWPSPRSSIDMKPGCNFSQYK